MSNYNPRPATKESGLYHGKLHNDPKTGKPLGGIEVVVDEVTDVEVEGEEYHICSDAMNSNERYAFRQKTNKQILDKLFKEEGCVFEQGKANSGDFILCRLVVNDKTLHDRTGTVKEILNEMQAEKSCRVSGGAREVSKVNKKGGDVKNIILLTNDQKKEIIKSIELGYNQVVVGMISPKKKGVMLIDKDSRVRGTYPIEIKSAIEQIIEEQDCGCAHSEMKEGGKIKESWARKEGESIDEWLLRLRNDKSYEEHSKLKTQERKNESDKIHFSFTEIKKLSDSVDGIVLADNRNRFGNYDTIYFNKYTTADYAIKQLKKQGYVVSERQNNPLNLYTKYYIIISKESDNLMLGGYADGGQVEFIANTIETKAKANPDIYRDFGYISYENVLNIAPQVNFENLPQGIDEASREARSQIMREQESKPPKFTKHKIGTKAVDRFGDVYELQELPFEKIIIKNEGTQRKSTIDKYAAWLKDGSEMPPLRGVENFAVEGGRVKIIDGNHRAMSAKEAGLKTVPVWVSLTDKKNVARPVYAKNEIAEAYINAKEQKTSPELIKKVEEILKSNQLMLGGYAVPQLQDRIELVKVQIKQHPENSSYKHKLALLEDWLEKEKTKKKEPVKDYIFGGAISKTPISDNGVHASNNNVHQLMSSSPTLNAEQNKLINSPAFIAWFGDWKNSPETASKVVDELGFPAVVYHGTNNEFTEFDMNKIGSGSGNYGHYGYGAYFSFDKREAVGYGERLIPAFVNIRNPFYNKDEFFDALRFAGIYWIEDKVNLSIEYQSLYKEVNRVDRVAAELLNLLHEQGIEEGWRKFLESYKGNATVDLNDIADLYEYSQKDNGVPDLSDFKYQIDVNNLKYNTGYLYGQSLHWVTELGSRSKEVTEAMISLGYDGVIVGSECIAFNANQIKLADGTNVEFSSQSNDIRMNEGGEVNKTKKIIRRNLPINKEYKLIDSFYTGGLAENPMSCDNCGRPIANVGVIEDSDNKQWHVGMDCAETLSNIKDSPEFSFAQNDFAEATRIRNKIKNAHKKYPTALLIAENNPMGKISMEMNDNRVGRVFSEYLEKDFVFKYLPEIKSKIINPEKNGFIPKYSQDQKFDLDLSLFRKDNYISEKELLFDGYKIIISRYEKPNYDEATNTIRNYNNIILVKVYKGSKFIGEDDFYMHQDIPYKIVYIINEYDFNNYKEKDFKQGGSLLLAPNGKPSNLTPEQYKLVRGKEFIQWFGNWLALAEAKQLGSKIKGDVYIGIFRGNEERFLSEIAQQVNNSEEEKIGAIVVAGERLVELALQLYPNAKVGDKFYPTVSKVVDENGEPLICYHGSPKQFNAFIKSEIGELGEGIYLTQNKREATEYAERFNTETPTVLNLFVNLKNPFHATKGADQFWKKFGGNGVSDKQATLNMVYGGYDGVLLNAPETHFNSLTRKIEKTGKQRNHILCVEADQIKLADGSNITFDSNNPDIRFKEGGYLSQLKKGTEVEREHAATLRKIYEHKIPLTKAPELIAKDHLKELPDYYTRLDKMEHEMKSGGDINTTDSGKAISASSRFRPYETIFFDPAIVGLNGAKLISYQWAYEWTEDWDNIKGETVSKRISDWTQAEQNADTGRNIVHQYTVEKPNGEVLTVSSESVLHLLGYTERETLKSFPSLVNAVKTLAKQRMKLAILEAQLKEYRELESKFEKAEKPAIVEIEEPVQFIGVQESYKNMHHNVYAMGDVNIRQDNDAKYDQTAGKTFYTRRKSIDNQNKQSLEREWVLARIKEAGGIYPTGLYDLKNRVARQERKVELLTGSKISIVDVKS